MQLSPAVEKYVLHWGEMGTRWGTNRTVAQIHALLYLSPEPMRADEICELLSVARSNVSTSIRELQSYGLVRMVHELGDRRDYFESIYDVWELFRVIIEQRKQRELNPTLTMLRSCAEDLSKEKDGWNRERLFRPDVGLTAWRKHCHENARAVQKLKASANNHPSEEELTHVGIGTG